STSHGATQIRPRLLHDARREREGDRRRHPSRLPAPGARVPSRPQPRQRRGRGALQGDQRGVRRADRSRQAAPVRPRPPDRRATDGERAPLPPPRGALGHLAAAGRWLLGPPRPEALRTSDIVVTVALTVAEAAQGGKKRVALGDGAAAEDVLVTIPAGVREG